MWFAMKVRIENFGIGRSNSLRNAIKQNALSSITALIKRGLKFIWNCPATKMLVVVMGVVLVMLILNIVMVAVG